MPSRLTRAEVERIAALANLELTEDEKDLFTRQLADILAYADAVREVETADVPPTSHVLTRHPSVRADEVRPSLARDEALANAPDASADAGLFRVPRVIG
jgi:aspartyl-tRNA(Asn)/glutamyl-tRNA(Gln) amidotransferase subunit C